MRCGRPLRGPPDLVFTCVPCRRRRLYFSQARAVGIYDGTLRDAVHALKFRGRAALSEPLGLLMAAGAQADPVARACDVIVPVPLHPHRQAARGFNQSELLARKIATALGRPVDVQVLRRTRDTPEQVGLPRADRRRNVRAAFAAATLMAERILLVDDVLSTGFTAASCAQALRAAGASEVAVLALARAVLD